MWLSIVTLSWSGWSSGYCLVHSSIPNNIVPFFCNSYFYCNFIISLSCRSKSNVCSKKSNLIFEAFLDFVLNSFLMNRNEKIRAKTICLVYSERSEAYVVKLWWSKLGRFFLNKWGSLTRSMDLKHVLWNYKRWRCLVIHWVRFSATKIVLVVILLNTSFVRLINN